VLEDVTISRFPAARGVSPSRADLADELEVWMYPDLSATWQGFGEDMTRRPPDTPGRPSPSWPPLVVTHVVGPAMSLIPATWLLALKAVSNRFVPCRYCDSALATVALCAGILIGLRHHAPPPPNHVETAQWLRRAIVTARPPNRVFNIAIQPQGLLCGAATVARALTNMPCHGDDVNS
jgi:hypothetical protein